MRPDSYNSNEECHISAIEATKENTPIHKSLGKVDNQQFHEALQKLMAKMKSKEISISKEKNNSF